MSETGKDHMHGGHQSIEVAKQESLKGVGRIFLVTEGHGGLSGGGG